MQYTLDALDLGGDERLVRFQCVPNDMEHQNNVVQLVQRMVSDGICFEEAAKLGFRHFASVQEALDAALAQKGTGARVTVLTHAPDMLPRIAGA